MQEDELDKKNGDAVNETRNVEVQDQPETIHTKRDQSTLQCHEGEISEVASCDESIESERPNKCRKHEHEKQAMNRGREEDNNPLDGFAQLSRWVPEDGEDKMPKTHAEWLGMEWTENAEAARELYHRLCPQDASSVAQRAQEKARQFGFFKYE